MVGTGYLEFWGPVLVLYMTICCIVHMHPDSRYICFPLTMIERRFDKMRYPVAAAAATI